MGSISESMQQFEAAFAKLKHNRENIPLEQLQTRYGRAYRELVEEVRNRGTGFMVDYLMAGKPPLTPQQNAVFQRERQSGGLIDLAMDALIDQLDFDAFQDICKQLYDKIYKEEGYEDG